MAESGTRRSRTDNDIFTVLLLIALVALIAGVGYLWYRDSQLTGSMNPFKLSVPNSVAMVQPLTSLG